jgi:hypothetical protein
MILEISEHSSLFIRLAAAMILAVHITAGVTGLLSGVVTLSFRKGSRAHRVAGNVFFVAMLVACAIGAAVGPFLPTPLWSNLLAGLLACYLLATSWRTAHYRDVKVNAVDVAACLTALAIAALAIYLTLRGMVKSTGFTVTLLALLSAAGDAKMILNGGITGASRLARHLWRMLFPMFLAAGAFFLGQPQIMPAFLRGSYILFLPQLAIVIAMVFWLVRLKLKKDLISAG